MSAWGGRGFAKNDQPAVNFDEDSLRICLPTLGELAEEYGFGVAARQLGCLAVAVVGLLLACGSSLSLKAKRHE